MSLLDLDVICPYYTSMVYVLTRHRCYMSLLDIGVICPNLTSMVYVLT